jgi:hypothetical protein
MDAGEFFRNQGTYINASHLAAGELKLTIRETRFELVGTDQEQKIVIFFKEVERGLPLKLTNYNSLNEAFGPETDGWLGKQVTLYSEKTKFKDKEVDGVRMRIDLNDYVPLTQRPKPKPISKDDMADEIPF